MFWGVEKEDPIKMNHKEVVVRMGGRWNLFKIALTLLVLNLQLLPEVS
jgi:hypothetical protein